LTHNFVTVVNAPVPVIEEYILMKNVSGARNSGIGTFTKIVRESYQKLVALEVQQQDIKEKFIKPGVENVEREFELMGLNNEINKCVVLVIVFSAIAVEAYIYDYAARNLSDTFAKNYLDKLDPISKWVIIPRLVTGKELPRDHRWFELLNKLFLQRNKIVHEKSSSPPIKFEDALSYFKRLQLNSELTDKTAKEAIELLDILPNEMREIDPDEISWIHGYLLSDPDNPFTLLEEK
jgi:hypothetical protein